MRIIRDGLGRITATDGTILHDRIRYQIADDRRVAVWEGDTKLSAFPPTHVYSAGEVSVKPFAGCPICQGYTSKQTLTALWKRQEAAHSV